jgi:hypothetical protein
MPKDAPPNGGALLEPVREGSFKRVSGMQTKFSPGMPIIDPLRLLRCSES